MKQVALNETRAINEKFGVKVTKRKSVTIKSKKQKSKELVESDDEDNQEENHQRSVKLEKSSKKRKISVASSDETKDSKRVKKDKLTANEEEFAAPAPITSTPHIKSKKRNNTVSSEDTANDDTTAVKYMVQIPMPHANDDHSDASNEKKKKKKKDKSPEKTLNRAIHDSEAEISASSSVSGGKKKKKDKSPQKNFNRSLHDSEAEASTSSSMSEGKKNKKPAQQKSKDEISLPGERPPSTVLDYYAKCVYSGKPHKVQRSFEKLSQKEKKELTAQHNEKVEKYVGQLKSYLGSLTKEEALLYVSI